MIFITLFTIIISSLCPVLSQPECGDNSLAVYVDGVNGNDSSCVPRPHGDKSSPCRTLTHAVNIYRNNCVSYVVLSSKTILGSVSPFSNVHGISFQGTENSTVVCEDNAGLAFFNVSNLSFRDISFLHCGALRNSTSKKYGTQGNFSLQEFKVALYFDGCSYVSMFAVSVKSSRNATGVVMYNTGGINNIQSSEFVDNCVSEGQPGGGGFYVEFTYCLPGDMACVNGQEYINMRNAQYIFTDSTFSDNVASTGESKARATYIIPFESNHHAFGRGGGLSMFVKGTAAFNALHVTNCTFLNNKAEWGGGGFIEFHDNAGSNVVQFTNCTFKDNFCAYDLTQGTGGGGLRIGHYVYGRYEARHYEGGNTITVEGCHFLSNSAMYGGGISISPALQTYPNYTAGMESSVLVDESYFHNNTAMMGAAINIMKFALVLGDVMLQMVLRNITVYKNSAFYAKIIQQESTPHTEGVGALYIQQVYTIFQGYSEFVANTHSGIAIVGMSADFTDSCTVFKQNLGYRGGGISLLGMAYILISESTQMVFESNLVRNSGGAIHNRYVEMDNMKTRSNCFIKHSDPFRKPNEWGASFIFRNNTIRTHEDNAIHSSSILPCAWAGGNGYSYNVSDIFCWDGWSYLDKDGQVVNCIDQVSSDAGNVTFDVYREANEVVHVDAIPGWDFNLPLSIEDDYRENINNTIVFAIIKDNSIDHNTTYTWGNIANLKGEENSSNSISLESLGDRIWEVNLIVDLNPCPLGFVLGDDGSCTCPNGTFGGIMSCDSGTKTIFLNDNDIWLGTLNNSSDNYIGLCPPGFCNSSLIINYHNCSNCTINFCSRNREGVMCSRCIGGYGTAVNSLEYDCVECSHDSLARNLPQYIAAVYIPLTLMFGILIFFDIRLTTGPANAFILYCQAVSSTFGLGVGVVPLNDKVTSVTFLDKMYQFLYGIFNLEFFENLARPWCLRENFSTLAVLSLDYGVAIYPLLMIFLALLYLKFKERLCRCTCWSRINCEVLRRRNSTLGEALLPGFAAFILLSYNKFGLTASYILAVQPLIADNGSTVSSRIYYAGDYMTNSAGYKYYFISSVVAFGFVCAIPILLLVYPLKLVEWVLCKVPLLWNYYPVDKIHFFLDNFQGCYKTKMRFFAGLYFLFRLLINSAYLATVSWTDQFIVQQLGCIIMVALLAVCRPYTKENNFLNYVDILIFINLMVINALSFYLYVDLINGQHPSKVVAIMQYILVFLPLVYMLAYIGYLVLKRQRFFKNYLNSYRRERRHVMLSRATISQIFTTQAPPSDEDYDDDIFQRAENTNKYKKLEDDRSIDEKNSERNSNRQSGSVKRLSAVTQSSGSVQSTSGYGSCQKTTAVSSVQL